MAKADRSNVDGLMAQADGLDFGSVRLGLLQEAVRVADLLNDVDLAYEARVELITTATLSGAPEVALVAFTWCLARFDAEPSRFSEILLLRQYEWVVRSMASFPQFSRAQIEDALADLARRVLRAGFGMRSVHEVRFQVADYLGDDEEFERSRALWKASEPDELAGPLGSSLGNEVISYARAGRFEEAVRLARPLLEGPARRFLDPFTLANLLQPLFRTGRVDEALELHRSGYRQVATNRDFLSCVADHVQLLALTDNLDAGLKLFQGHLAWALETYALLDRFAFNLMSRFLFDRLRAGGTASVSLRLPDAFPIHDPPGRYAVADLLGWLEGDVAGLARRFDDRNGNAKYAGQVEESRGWGALVRPTPLRPGSGRSKRGKPAP